MVNERMNMEEISREIAALPAGTDPKKLILLSKQAHDEAKHFQFVKEVVEYLKGEEINMQEAVESHAERLHQKGAALIKKYNCNSNPLMLGLYQLLAEGRAARNWAMMAECIEDKFISSRYAKIAKDETFHATIGRMELEKLCVTQEAQDEINAVINEFRKDLFAITSSKTGTLEQSAKLMEVYA
jgi:1,2-phenylacetyl-CoA epoxidase catalytic subunit